MKYLLRILVAAGAHFVQSSAPRRQLSEQADYLGRRVRTGQRQRYDLPRHRPAARLALNESVIVENRPGANGALAAQYVARSAPDGYTLLMATNSPLSAVPFMMKKSPYDAVKDFTPITRVGSFTLMLVVNPSIPVKINEGADRLRQGQSGQAVVCQRQHLRHRRRRDAQALGRNRLAARALQKRAAGSPGSDRGAGVDDVHRPHDRAAARPIRRAARAWR